MQVWKYKLNDFEQTIEMPKGAKILDVQLQDNDIQMWVLVDPQNALEKRTFLITGTGINIDTEGLSYIATVQRHMFVWHVFEKIQG